MPRVKNLETGLEHDVPEGHFSLKSLEYEVLDSKPKPKKQPKAPVTPPEVPSTTKEG